MLEYLSYYQYQFTSYIYTLYIYDRITDVNFSFKGVITFFLYLYETCENTKFKYIHYKNVYRQ